MWPVELVLRFLLRPTGLTAATIAMVAALFAVSPTVLELIELNWLDMRFRARGQLVPSASVVVAAVDEKSIAAEGRWPWKRSKMAALIDALSQDGARVISFDVLFSESERDARLALIDELERNLSAREIHRSQLSKLLREKRRTHDHDQLLATAVERSDAPVVLGYFFHMTDQSVGQPLESADIVQRFEAIKDSKYPIVFRDAHARSPPLPNAFAPQINLGPFTKVAASSGYFSVASDIDGVVRWMPLVVEGRQDLYPPLAVLTVWHFLGKPQLAVHSGRYGVDGVQIGERFIPTDETGRLFINYRGPANTIPSYSTTDILSGVLPDGTFKDKIVLVGATATGIGDIRATPFGPLYPGPEVQASAIDNILGGDFIQKPRWTTVFDLSAIVALGLIIGVVLPRLSAINGLVFSGVTFFAYAVGTFWLFANARIVLSIVYPLATLAATYTILTVYRYLTEEQERRRIKDAFKHYVSPDVIEIMLKDPSSLRLGGQEKVLTALISDLEGYTSFSEHHTPNDVIAVLSEYYGEMTEEVFAVQGTLVEYVGDELFALYGAPVPQADHAKRACDSALAMKSHRARLSHEWAKIGRPPLKARTGINTGNMVVGNIGSKFRFHYGAMGDPVNLASRLEGLNKIYGTEIMISSNTAELVQGLYHLRELDLVRVKGRTQAVIIYELLGHRDVPMPAAQIELLTQYQQGLHLYRERQWLEAEEIFRQCERQFGSDGPSQLMAQRCRIYQTFPPSEDWGGTFEDRRGAPAKTGQPISVQS